MRNYYLVDNLISDASRQLLIKCVHVQANINPVYPVAESAWFQSVAARPEAQGLPTGVAGYVDFGSPDVERVLERHAAFLRAGGIRHVLNQDPVPSLNCASHDLLGDATWCTGIGLLRRLGWPFDAQVYWQ